MIMNIAEGPVLQIAEAAMAVVFVVLAATMIFMTAKYLLGEHIAGIVKVASTLVHTLGKTIRRLKSKGVKH